MSLPHQEDRIERLIELVEATLIDRQVDKEYREIHAEEHRFLRVLMKESEARTAFWISVANKVVSGGVWALIVGVFGAILFSAKYYLLSKTLL